VETPISPALVTPLISGLVSTIIPVYNRLTLLQEAVTSVLAQTYRHFEIILVDDGSKNETARFCDELANAHPEITTIHLRHGGCAGRSREAGRQIARGEFIQYLDSDDLISPRKFEVFVKALNENPDCDIAYCFTRRHVRGELPVDVPCERTGETFKEMLPECLRGRFWHTSTPLYTRRICDRAGPWSNLRFWEDVEYDLRIATLRPKLFHCREFLTDFRDHSEERLSNTNFFDDPTCMRHAPEAYRALLLQAKTSGVSIDHPAMQAFLAELKWVGEKCQAIGLETEAREFKKLQIYAP
jgi:glycosyltransferase involved in cell wall biosynthesis